MKNKTLVLIFAILFVFGSAAAFVMFPSRDSTFWTGYCSALVALVILLVGSIITIKCTNNPSSYLFITSSILYMVAVAITVYYTVDRVATNIFIGIEILLVAIYLIILVVGARSVEYIKDQDEEIKHHKNNLNGLINMVSEANFDGSEKVLEALKYSDPVISAEAKNAFADVEIAVSDLCCKKSKDVDKCISMIKHLNTINKQSKR